jgi:hypothetical protein
MMFKIEFSVAYLMGFEMEMDLKKVLTPILTQMESICFPGGVHFDSESGDQLVSGVEKILSYVRNSIEEDSDENRYFVLIYINIPEDQTEAQAPKWCILSGVQNSEGKKEEFQTVVDWTNLGSVRGIIAPRESKEPEWIWPENSAHRQYEDLEIASFGLNIGQMVNNSAEYRNRMICHAIDFMRTISFYLGVEFDSSEARTLSDDFSIEIDRVKKSGISESQLFDREIFVVINVATNGGIDWRVRANGPDYAEAGERHDLY